MLGEPPSIVLWSRGAISWLWEATTTNPFSPATPRVVVGSLTLASWSHYVPGWLEPFSTILLLRSTDSAFSLQSAPSVHLAIARWKYNDTFLQTAPGLLTAPWLTHFHQLRTLSTSWRSIQVLSPSSLKNDLPLVQSLHECSFGLLFCFCR